MATTWIDLIGYVRVRYEIFQQSEHTLRFYLPTTEDRTQRVAVHHVDEDWIVIESAVGRADDVDLRRLLELAGESPIGGIVVVGGVALLRHAVHLADLSLDGFDRPFHLVTEAADALEHKLTGADHF